MKEENGKPVKSQGIPTVCPVSRSSNEATSPYHSRRKMRKLRDHNNIRTPSNLDILELHTREVLKRLEMCPWEEVSITLHDEKKKLSCSLKFLKGVINFTL